MTRKYKITKYVGRPNKFSKQDFKDIIRKKFSDVEFAVKYNVTTGTIQAIRHNQSLRLKIPIKNKFKSYRKK